jgi:hypothetical protein
VTGIATSVPEGFDVIPKYQQISLFYSFTIEHLWQHAFYSFLIQSSKAVVY